MAKVKKSANDFNIYVLELSYGELLKIKELAKSTPDVIADELAGAIDWYLNNEVPAPGVDKKDFKAEKEKTAPEEEPQITGAEKPANLDSFIPEPPEK